MNPLRESVYRLMNGDPDDPVYLTTLVAFIGLVSVGLSLGVFLLTESIGKEERTVDEYTVFINRFVAKHDVIMSMAGFEEIVPGFIKATPLRMAYLYYLDMNGTSRDLFDLDRIQSFHDYIDLVDISDIEKKERIKDDIQKKISRRTSWRNLLFSIVVILQLITVVSTVRLTNLTLKVG